MALIFRGHCIRRTVLARLATQSCNRAFWALNALISCFIRCHPWWACIAREQTSEFGYKALKHLNFEISLTTGHSVHPTLGNALDYSPSTPTISIFLMTVKASFDFLTKTTLTLFSCPALWFSIILTPLFPLSLIFATYIKSIIYSLTDQYIVFVVDKAVCRCKVYSCNF